MTDKSVLASFLHRAVWARSNPAYPSAFDFEVNSKKSLDFGAESRHTELTRRQSWCRSHLAQAHIHQAGATAASALGQAIAGVPLYTWFFCGMIVLSRVAFWVYDMVDAQIFQTVSNSRIPTILQQCPTFLLSV